MVETESSVERMEIRDNRLRLNLVSLIFNRCI
jgi:hypothetical protein